MPEGGDTEAGAGVAGGSLIGMLVGVLGGPVGMLLSGSAGAASGALYDADRLDKGDEAIEQLGALMPTGGNALLGGEERRRGGRMGGDWGDVGSTGRSARHTGERNLRSGWATGRQVRGGDGGGGEGGVG